MSPELKSRLLDRATRPYQPTGRFNFHWARGKLRRDPVFAGLIDHGVIHNDSRVLDLGCGRGLLAAWLLSAQALDEEQKWPNGEPAPPSNLKICGVELMGREAVVGNQALQPLFGERVQLRGGDMLEADLRGFDTIVILDVLHYVPFVAQEALLDRIRQHLPSGGRLITRIGDARGGLRFKVSQWVDRCMSYAQGHRLPKMWTRPQAEWVEVLTRRGFRVKTIPMSEGTPFANVLLVADVV